MTDNFDPIRAIQTLKENYLLIESLGNQIEVKANQHALAEATLLDAEGVARAVYFTDKPCKISELPHWLKMKTTLELSNENRLKNELRILKGKLEILCEINNNVKASLKLAELDYRNQKYN